MLMKKIFIFIVWLILFSGYFSVIPQKNIITAAICGGVCTDSAECPTDCHYCRTEQLNLEALQSGIDLCYTADCKCFKEDFKSIKEGGSEQIVPYVEPLIENKTSTITTELPKLQDPVNKIVNASTGIGGVIAFILIVIGGFQIILSSGSPERVKAGKEMITSAIAGLLLIIFAVFILKLIGADILKIPEFTQLNK